MPWISTLFSVVPKDNGAFYNLTNENGDTSIGNLQGKNQIQAPGCQFVTGTLSSNGRQIQWSNGTFWCPTNNGGGGKFDLNGNWYPNGDRSMQCSIQQRRGNLQLQNESGQRATGSFNGKFNVTTNWQGTKISGTVSRDGNRINWDNGNLLDTVPVVYAVRVILSLCGFIRDRRRRGHREIWG
jgi:hypothetical protein